MDAAPNRKVYTAFLVVIDEDGNIQADGDVSQQLELTRAATYTDMFGACSGVVADLQASKTAQQVVQAQAQMVKAMQDSDLGRKLLQK